MSGPSLIGLTILAGLCAFTFAKKSTFERFKEAMVEFNWQRYAFKLFQYLLASGLRCIADGLDIVSYISEKLCQLSIFHVHKKDEVEQGQSDTQKKGLSSNKNKSL
jgi:hypothetical protein